MKRTGYYLAGLCLMVFTLMITGCGSDSSTPAVLSISTASLPAGTVGTAYSQTLVATGGTTPYTWSVSVGTLPAGLSLNTVTGAITGTPTTAGTTSVTFRVTDAALTIVNAVLPITINAAGALAITTVSPLPAGTIGTAYSQTLAAIGGTGTLTWTVPPATLPTGLSLSAAGVITGTPTTVGTASVNISVTDAALVTVTKTFSITINAVGTFTVTTTSPLPDATFGTAYAPPTLASAGGTGTVTWTSTALPSGLTLSTAGIITGRPLVSGATSFTVTATDSAVPAHTASQLLSLNITITASILNGKTIYDAGCAGCHNVGIYDTTGGAPNLAASVLTVPTLTTALTARFGGGATHNGNTLTATQITDMLNFLSVF